MSDSTPTFGLTLPSVGRKADWGASLNANFSNIDRVLASLAHKTLAFHLDPKSATLNEVYWLLGGKGVNVAGSAISVGGGDVTLSAGYGQGRLILEVTGGADTEGELVIGGASRLAGTGGLREPDTEIIPVDGVNTYLSRKTWRHTGSSHALTLASSPATDDVDLIVDARLLSIFDNGGRPFVLRKLELLGESTADSGFIIEAEKVVVDGYEVSFTELTSARLDLTESPAEPGVYHDFLVLEESINPCDGEGLLLSVTFDDPADWKSFRMFVGIEEDPVLPS
jgi:hypothetical protein